MSTRSALTISALAGALGLLAPGAVSGAPGNAYAQVNLVANRAEIAPGALIDPHMINPWGIALRPPGAGGHFWISNAGNASTSTWVGDAGGKPLAQDGLKIVYLDGPLLSYEDGLANVTGQVYNAASDFEGQPVEFVVSGPAHDLSKTPPTALGTVTGSAKFVFVTTDGTINAWRASTAQSMDSAIIVKDYSDHGPHQINALPRLPAFTGVAMSVKPKGGNRLYVTDFQNGIIRVLDNQWNDITEKVPFARPRGMRADLFPYNIQLLGERLYVTFAVCDQESEEAAFDVPGPGNGHVAAYDLDGHLVKDFADGSHLDSPWGLALAPAQGFGAMSGALLVANFGDGTISAFDPKTGAYRDYLRDPLGKPISIDGIWGLAFGNGVSLGDADSLYFTAGPNLEQDGLFGRLRLASPTSAAASEPGARSR